MMLLPPPLVLQPLEEARSSYSSSTPNLMPFSIEYTGPANVDGYLIQHTPQGQQQSTASSSSSSSASTEVYTHFRGRRLWKTRLALPEGWIGATYLVQKDAVNALAGEEVENGSQNGTTDGTNGNGLDEYERDELKRKKRRLAAAGSSNGVARASAAKPAATMASFSMDDDEEDQAGEDGDEYNDEEQAYDGEEQAYLSEGSIEEEVYPREAAAASRKAAPQPKIITSLSPLPYSAFEEIDIWNPDGKLDLGDEELIKVFGEWRGIARLVSLRPPVALREKESG